MNRKGIVEPVTQVLIPSTSGEKINPAKNQL